MDYTHFYPIIFDLSPHHPQQHLPHLVPKWFDAENLKIMSSLGINIQHVKHESPIIAMMTPPVKVRWIHLNKQTEIALTSFPFLRATSNIKAPPLTSGYERATKYKHLTDTVSGTVWWVCWVSVVIQMLIIWFRTKCIFWKTFINLWSGLMLDHLHTLDQSLL